MFPTRINWEPLEETFHRTNEKRQNKKKKQYSKITYCIFNYVNSHITFTKSCAWKVYFYTSTTSNATFLWIAFTLNQLPLDPSESSVHNG